MKPNTPVKLLSLSDGDWRQGISQQANSNVGGIFQTASNMDPFEYMGSAKPSLVAGSSYSSVTLTPKWLAAGGGTNIFYALADRNSGNTGVLLQINTDTNAVVDYSAQIWNGYGSATNNAGFLTTYKGKLVYADGNSVRSNVLASPLLASEKTLISSVGGQPTCSCVGADNSLYFGTNGGIVGKVSDVSTTGAPNSAAAFSGFTNEFTIRDMINDGKYLAIVGDTNLGCFATNTAFTTGKQRCQIQWWDYAKGVADVVWEFDDTYVTAMKYLDGNCYIFGYNNIWVCNLATPPRILFRFSVNSTITARPVHAGAVIKSQGSIYWVDGTASVGGNTNVWGYGNPIAGQPKIFFQPYIASAGIGNYGSCLLAINTNYYAGFTAPQILQINGGTTRNSLTLHTTNNTLDRTYQYGYTKVVLETPLAANESVTVTADTQNGTYQLYTGSITYNSSNPLKSLIFNRDVGSTSAPYFEDIDLQVATSGTTTVPSISKVELWAYPFDNQLQV